MYLTPYIQGFVKGYALLEFAQRREAEAAIAGMDSKALLGQDVRVSWAFVKDAATASASSAGRAARKH